MDELAVEVRERLRDTELLNDLGVLAADVGQAQVAEAVLRTALLLAPDAAVLENLEVLDALREGGFLGRLMAELVVSALGPDLPDNFDPLHNPAGPPGPTGELSTNIAILMRQAPALEWLYRSWADDASRDLMVRPFAFRLLGGREVSLPIGAERMRALIQDTRRLLTQEATVSLGFNGWSADRYDLAPLGCLIIADVHPLNILHTFLLEQYACPQHSLARVRPGDVVIDGGACWGDTALYFASQVGPKGHVVSYEFSPSNLDLLEANLAGNPTLGSRIEVEHRALWSRSDERLTIEGMGPATQVRDNGNGAGALTRAIDDVPGVFGLDRIWILRAGSSRR